MRICDELPTGWQCRMGEAATPLSENGYYHLPFESRKYGFELIMDTRGRPPEEHVVTLIPKDFGEGGKSGYMNRMGTVEVGVPDIESEQRLAAYDLWQKAKRIMEDASKGKYDRMRTDFELDEDTAV